MKTEKREENSSPRPHSVCFDLFAAADNSRTNKEIGTTKELSPETDRCHSTDLWRWNSPVPNADCVNEKVTWKCAWSEQKKKNGWEQQKKTERKCATTTGADGRFQSLWRMTKAQKICVLHIRLDFVCIDETLSWRMSLSDVVVVERETSEKKKTRSRYERFVEIRFDRRSTITSFSFFC